MQLSGWRLLLPHYSWDSYGGNTKQKPIKIRDTMTQKNLPSFAQHGVSQSGIPAQGAGTPSKPRDIEQFT